MVNFISTETRALTYFVIPLVNFDLRLREAKISGGLMPNNYKLVGMHLHWGSKKGQGSEHKLPKNTYDAEVNVCFNDSGLRTRIS